MYDHSSAADNGQNSLPSNNEADIGILISTTHSSSDFSRLLGCQSVRIIAVDPTITHKLYEYSHREIPLKSTKRPNSLKTTNVH